MSIIRDKIENTREALTSNIATDASVTTAVSDKVEDSQVQTNVPAGALFTDTKDWASITGKPTTFIPTTSEVQSIVGAMTSGNTESGINVTFEVADGTLDFALNASPVITLGGDLSGSVTLSNLTSGTLTATIADDSHNHVISNTDGLQTALDAKLDIVSSTPFLRSDTAGVKTSGNLTFNDGIILAMGTGTDVEVFSNGTDFYTDLNTTTSNWYIRDTTTTRFTFARSTGNFTATGNVTAYSDKRVKTNIEKIDNALNKVSMINGYTFDRTDVNTNRQTGVVAQEVQEVLPEAVSEDKEGNLSVAYGNMVGLLIESIKELRAEIEELKAK